LSGHKDWINGLAFSPDGKLLVSGSNDGTVKLWDVKSGKVKTLQSDYTTIVQSVAFSPDGSMLAAAEWGKQDSSGSFVSTDPGAVTLWDVATGEVLYQLPEQGGAAWSVVFSKDGNVLAVANARAEIKLWGLATQKIIITLRGHTNTINTLAVSPDGKWLASASDDGLVILWYLGVGK
jgi:WD40 repeat protein